jgi:phosphoribosylformylglycinamidine cyclo-ligase
MTRVRHASSGEVLERGMTYAGAGVDQDVMNAAAKSLLGSLRFRREGMGAPYRHEGGFSGLIEFGDVLLGLATDGVGTKSHISQETGRWDTIGIDCVAMNVNDLICVGAEPLAFVDYIATPRPDPDVWASIGVGLDEGCRLSNMTLVGGETSVMPETVRQIDITGTALGYVPRDRVITGMEVSPGDAIIGLASSGIHSNGYTLVRRVVSGSGHAWDEPFGGRTLGEEALEPTTIYVRAVMELVKEVEVRAMANITGGGLRNMARWREGLRYVVDDPLPVPPILEALQHWGEIEDREMWQTFNMGTGFVIAVAEGDVDEALAILRPHHESQVVGRVEEGTGVAHEGLGIEYTEY